jgi:AhpD family alkylhydroperoxidase
MNTKTTAISLAFLSTLSGAALAETSPADAARADIQKTVGFLPGFFKALPDSVLPGAWAELKQFENTDTALPMKVKGLIGLAVAAQIPSRNVIYLYSRCVRANGATEAEAKEAVAIAALARHWSTYFNGSQLDEAAVRTETTKILEYGAKMASGKAPPPRPMEVTDARSAQEDIKQYFGFVPGFVQKFPAEALPGAWLELKTTELGETALSGKYKSLISLGVASQIPCRYCVAMDTQFAKAEGATDREIQEAITMAGVVRHSATLIDGLQLDDKALRKDIDRMIPDGPRTRLAKGR